MDIDYTFGGKVMTNEELIKSIREGNDDARNTLALKNAPLVYKIMGEFSYLCRNEDHKNELFQAGQMGLAKALSRYCESFNTKFSTFAFRFIRGEILREAASIINASTELIRETGEFAYSAEDLTDYVHNTIYGEATCNVEQEALNKILTEKMLSMVTDRQRKILELHYNADMSQREIGMILGIHQVEVSREEKKAKTKIKIFFKDEECNT